MAHIVLLGDSVFDNTPYAPIGEDVVSHLKYIMPEDWQVTLLAKDRCKVRDVYRQLSRIPIDATHLVLSIGGNDAMAANDIFDKPVKSVGEALNRLADVSGNFELDYTSLLRSIRTKGFRTIICTIYYPNFQDASFQRTSRAALTHFNDSIIRAAFDTFTTLIDLRLLFSETSDYANEVEPSSQGGKKIAGMIFGITSRHG